MAKIKKKTITELNVEAHNRMGGMSEEGADEAFFMEHGYRPSKEHTKESVAEIAENLISVAKRIYDWRIAVALGEKPDEALNRGMVEYQQYIIDLVEPMIKSYQQTRNIEANSASSVITMLTSGKIKPKEAIELLTVIGKTIEVEEKELRRDIQRKLMEEKE